MTSTVPTDPVPASRAPGAGGERAGSDDLLALAQAWREAGHGVALATVTATWGSSPTPVGSLLVVREDGRFRGSVSGGCVEGAVIEEARAALADGRHRRLAFSVADERAWEVGLTCGGAMEVFVETVS